MPKLIFIFFFFFFFVLPISGFSQEQVSLQNRLQARLKESSKSKRANLIFDIPLTYNKKVSYWLEYYQTRGKAWFSSWLALESKYMPIIQRELQAAGLPQDLAYMVMIESGFEANGKKYRQCRWSLAVYSGDGATIWFEN
jgi:hypothetical protein